jgi:hypothetical protein
MLHNLDDGRRQLLTVGAWPAYSNTGHILYGQLAPILYRGIWALPVSLKTLKPTGGSFSIDPDGTNESVAQDGTLVYLRGGHAKQKQLVWLDRDGLAFYDISDVAVMVVMTLVAETKRRRYCMFMPTPHTPADRVLETLAEEARGWGERLALRTAR